MSNLEPVYLLPQPRLMTSDTPSELPTVAPVHKMEAAFLPFLFPSFLPSLAQLQPENQLGGKYKLRYFSREDPISGEAKAGAYFLQTFRESVGSTFLHLKLPNPGSFFLLPFAEKR